MTATDDRAAGTLLGLACGDALGRPVAGWSGTAIADRHGRLTEMRGGGRAGRPAGATTGVTARALRAVRTLGGSEAVPPTDAPVPAPDGPAVLADAAPAGVAHHGAPDRLPAVVPGLLPDDADERATAAGVALARVVAELVGGAAPATALDDALAGAADRDAPPAVRTALAVATDDATAPPGASPDAVAALETALGDGLTAATAEEAVVAAVNRGGATTAVGAAAGAVAGARFGATALPGRWLDPLDDRPLRAAARTLVEGPSSDPPPGP